ncbi:Lsr2 family protein [Actinoplanes sp. NPDC051346]|uniref:histone-like nucleoid-structuring protein Lsr2 n=1 Tax=Actinoplanes sp. NPDC051346 TaxID=3155048 RepID=UPI003431F3EB
MAKQIIETLIDDVDGSVATETVTFSLDGTNYTIDLNETNAAALREAMAPYAGAASKIGRGAGVWRPGIVPSRTRQAAKADNKAIREWAANNGHQLSERGRIPQHVTEAYEAAQKAPVAPPAKPAKASKAAESAPAKATKRAPRKKAAAVQFKAS